MWTRRDVLRMAGNGFGWTALSGLTNASFAEAKAKAKAVIYLFMHGGVSHVDTFDPKPALQKWSGQRVPPELAKGLKTSRIDFAKALVRGSAWKFERCGQSGTEISALF